MRKKRPARIVLLFGFYLAVSFADSALGQSKLIGTTSDLPEWVSEVGARRAPERKRKFLGNSFGAVGDGVTNSTKAIQKAIDSCASAGGGVVHLRPGVYLTGALFLKSNVNLRVDQGVTLLGSLADADYPSIWTRVAGIEMKWPAALINVNDQKNVRFSGAGIIDGQAKKRWERYLFIRPNYQLR